MKLEKKIMIIDTGGTFGQVPNRNGALEIDACTNVFEKVLPLVSSIAKITPYSGLERMDSTEMAQDYRKKLAELIYKEKDNYDGFVVIHGTDTMVDTGAALNYMLPDFGKPIVLTGAQKSIYEKDNDAERNIKLAVKAAKSDLGEVVIAFDNKVLRACRAQKYDSEGFNAFITPAEETLGKEFKYAGLGSMLKLYDNRIPRSSGKGKLFTDFDTGVILYKPTSGSTADTLENYINDDKVSAAVISGFGTGNVPSRLGKQYASLVESGKPVVQCTRCLKGRALVGTYAVSSEYANLVISAGDMTEEAACQKTMYAVGVAKYEGRQGIDLISRVKDIILTPQRGDVQL